MSPARAGGASIRHSADNPRKGWLAQRLAPVEIEALVNGFEGVDNLLAGKAHLDVIVTVLAAVGNRIRDRLLDDVCELRMYRVIKLVVKLPDDPLRVAD